MATYQLRNIPHDVREIIIHKQAEIMQERNKITSQETVIYKIIREWKELKTNKKKTA